MINVYTFGDHGLIVTGTELIIILDNVIFGPFPKEKRYIEKILEALSN